MTRCWGNPPTQRRYRRSGHEPEDRPHRRDHRQDLAYQKQSPNRAGQLRSFLSYYLPTTLKILRAYARMEEQGVEGENIRSAKARIEGMMDKVVEGFEKQLDKLFQDDAMDIATDVQVLERMLEKDGLSGGGMTLGG
ncbi:MAG: 5-bromo-4-chloroindolyl phosphate hydrolysis family protein [Flavonifractor plautii]